ncbi:hypothetical protein JOC75_001638 [Metabacillus crassostreae]|uniref:acyltransferase family protein n=1 Tax=Metabacillus crassostreae TaxID=929098 RepID=UPI001958BFE7|nr:acyltransferase [Metabacillus crassostreae]MBM7603665.1 hypothetical protein [Metabacillus crassostreae]
MNKKGVSRRYDLDWLKVIATLFVFLYHCSMYFNPFTWHVKNNQLDNGIILTISLLIGIWIMPLFFVLSGISTSYSLSKRNAKSYLLERFIRLGIPLLFGIFILSPPQVYIERLDHSQFSDSFLAFIPHYFNGFYLEIGGSGNFAFVGLHLWYLLALLIFSIITMPLLLKFQPIKQVSFYQFIFIPIAFTLVSIFSMTVNLGGWDLLVYLILFLVGYFFFSSNSILRLIQQKLSYLLIITIISLSTYIIWFHLGVPEKSNNSYFIFVFLSVISSWNLILSFYYLTFKYLSFTNTTLKYCSEAAMPFYVLHQPIIVLIGFMIKDLQWPILIKFPVLIFVSFILIGTIYHFVIRHFNVLRILFGMKGKGNPNKTVKRNSILA